MKKIYNYAFKLVCIYILILSIFLVSNIELKVDKYSNDIQDLNQEKIVVSSLLASSEGMIKEKEESIKEEITIVEVPSIKEEEQEVVKEEKIVELPKPVETVNLVDTSSFTVLSEEMINMSHYGHNCYGCTSFHTASGYYIGDGRIYYQDNTFGSVRIVAADDKYPLGTIFRIGYHGSTITAIVLDRGGAISDSSKYQVDLLTSNEEEASKLGIVQNTKLEVLRLGY